MYETQIKGDTNELRCILDFQKRGFYCSLPFSGSCVYDMIVDINDKLYKIQCKSSAYRNGSLTVNLQRQTTNTKETVKYCYKTSEVNYFYTSYNNFSFLVPNTGKYTTLYLRVDKPKSAFLDTINVASDYLFDNVIDSILNEKKINKFIDRRIQSIDDFGNIKVWTREELHKTYSSKQIYYIKDCIAKQKRAYGLKWVALEFPDIFEEYQKLQNNIIF